VIATSLLVRPTFLLLYRGVAPTSTKRADLRKELAALALAMVAGSGFMLLVAGVGEHSGVDVVDVVADAAAFGATMLVIAAWQFSRTEAAVSDGAAPSHVRTIVIGDGPLLASYIAALDSVPRPRFDVVAVATHRPAQYGTIVAGRRVTGSSTGLAEIARTTPFDHAVVLVESMPASAVDEVCRVLGAAGCPVSLVTLAPQLLDRAIGSAR